MRKLAPWVLGVVLVWAFSGHADDTLETLDYRCEFTGNCNLSSGLRGPSDPTWEAGLDRWLLKEQLHPSKSVLEELKLGPKTSIAGQLARKETLIEETKTGPIEVIKTDVPKVPVWPRSVSIGKPYQGWLAHAVRLDATKRYNVRKKKNFGTLEMVEAIKAAVDAVHQAHPNTAVLAIGNLSRKGGGRFPPHKSHQSGRDADIGYFMKRGQHPRRLRLATRRTIDAPRTWTFVESLMADNKVEYIFMDRRLIRVLFRHAKRVAKVPQERLDAYFDSKRGYTPILRHLRGHADHMHVRFYARESVRAVKEFVRRNGASALKPVPRYAKIRRGDSLWRIAKRHRTSIKKLRRWNRIRRRAILRPGKKIVVGWRRPKLP